LPTVADLPVHALTPHIEVGATVMVLDVQITARHHDASVRLDFDVAQRAVWRVLAPPDPLDELALRLRPTIEWAFG